MLERPGVGDINGEENTLYATFNNKTNEFVKLYLEDYDPPHTNNKVIHDPVWGTTLFYRWELQILDSPLLQRLRHITQLGLTMLTYPSAHHSRFEHTLGVMSVVAKMVTHINQNDKTPSISNHDLYLLRMAALLHDVGHCFFSHLSESIYGKFGDFVKLKKSFEIFENAKEHEIFAYIIINTEAFKNFIKNKVIHLWDASISHNQYDQLFRDIGYMIVGAYLDYDDINKAEPPFEKKYYMTQIINGPYDADKLDYLRRDSYTPGLALTYDIDRFLYKIRIADRQDEEKTSNGSTVIGKHLVIPVSGVSAVEEMAFSQMMLASYIYQHQKVLATDVLASDVVEALMRNAKLSHPCDFLYYCDCDILGVYSTNPDADFKGAVSDKLLNEAITQKKISDIVKNLKTRSLPKRAFIINTSTVSSSSLPELSQNLPKIYIITDLLDRIKELVKLREAICQEATNISKMLPLEEQRMVDIYDIHISTPKANITKDLSNALVKSSAGDFKRLSDIVRLSDWADAFAWHKWNAYIFAREDILPIVSIASKTVLEKYGLKFNEDTVFTDIKSSKEIRKPQEYLKSNCGYPTPQ